MSVDGFLSFGRAVNCTADLDLVGRAEHSLEILVRVSWNSEYLPFYVPNSENPSEFGC